MKKSEQLSLDEGFYEFKDTNVLNRINKVKSLIISLPVEIERLLVWQFKVKLMVIVQFININGDNLTNESKNYLEYFNKWIR